MINIKQDSDKFPFYHAIIVLLLAVGLCGIPLDYFFKTVIKDEKVLYLFCESMKRIIIGSVAIFFIYKYGFSNQLKNKISLISFILVIPAFIVVINNFPIIGVCKKNIVFDYSKWQFILFFIYSFSVAFFEEVVFRGIVFPLCLKKLNNKKYFVFWSIVLSSSLFSASHFLNLFGGAGIVRTILQVGYSFLIGSMCAITLVKTKNIIIPILLHFIFDIGGLLTSSYGIASGNQWDTITIIITAVLGAIVTVYMLFMTLKFNNDDIDRLYNSIERKK